MTQEDKLKLAISEFKDIRNRAGALCDMAKGKDIHEVFINGFKDIEEWASKAFQIITQEKETAMKKYNVYQKCMHQMIVEKIKFRGDDIETYGYLSLINYHSTNHLKFFIGRQKGSSFFVKHEATGQDVIIVQNSKDIENYTESKAMAVFSLDNIKNLKKYLKNPPNIIYVDAVVSDIKPFIKTIANNYVQLFVFVR